MKELIGKYLNGYKIVRIEKDPFIKGQINLWTDEEIRGTFNDRSIVKFFIREDSNSNKIYQELMDKEIYDLKKEKQELIEYLKNQINECHLTGNDEADMFYTGKMRAFQQVISKIEKE